MARIIAVSSGCTTLTCPSGTTLPSATATMSIWASEAHASAARMSAQIPQAVSRSVGDAGVSITSRAAGRNSRSSDVRRGLRRNRPNTTLPCTTGLPRSPAAEPGFGALPGGGLACGSGRSGVGSTMASPGRLADEIGVEAVVVHQRVVRAGLGELAALHDDDAIGMAHGREPVRHDQDGATLADCAHVVLDHALALVVERRGRL